jgi:hypothetical protein
MQFDRLQTAFCQRDKMQFVRRLTAFHDAIAVKVSKNVVKNMNLGYCNFTVNPEVTNN